MQEKSYCSLSKLARRTRTSKKGNVISLQIGRVGVLSLQGKTCSVFNSAVVYESLLNSYIIFNLPYIYDYPVINHTLVSFIYQTFGEWIHCADSVLWFLLISHATGRQPWNNRRHQHLLSSIYFRLEDKKNLDRQRPLSCQRPWVSFLLPPMLNYPDVPQ